MDSRRMAALAGAALVWILPSCTHNAGPPAASCSPAAAASAMPTSAHPTVAGGRIVLNEGASGQTFTVPRGTIVEVDLVTHAYGPWHVPASSDPAHLPRLSGVAVCDGTATATFRADGSGEITSTRANQEVTEQFTVSIVVAQ